MMKDRVEICLSGAGGQGLILAGIILAEAAGIYEGKEVVQTQSYGPEARGGASKSEVIISSEPIAYPKVIKADILLALTQTACDKYIKNLSRDGLLIVDSSLVPKIPVVPVQIYPFPITKIAQERLGTKLVINIISLGIIAGLTGVVSREALKEAVYHRVPSRVKEINDQALSLGFDLAQELKLRERMSQINTNKLK